MVGRLARGIGALVVAAALGAACHRGGDGAPTSSPPDISGAWVDALGDAPWQEIKMTPSSARHGDFVGTRCHPPPCQQVETGAWDLDGNRLTMHTPRMNGKTFEVHVGGGFMEWRENDVTIRRFRHVGPPIAPPPPTPRWPPISATPAPGTPCDSMTTAACVLSTWCVLDPPPRGSNEYVCRPAVPPCEGGVAQWSDGFEADCRKRSRCAYEDGSCFCRGQTKTKPAPGSDEAQIPAVQCACGGGPFRRCVPTK